MKTNTEMLELYQQAEIAVLSGKEFMLAGRKVVREDLAMIQSGMRVYERKIQTETQRSSGKSSFAVADFSNLT